MRKSITLIAGSEVTKKALEKQIIETIPSIKVNSFSIDEDKDIEVEDELVVLSSGSINEEIKDKGIDLSCKNVIIANRAISYDYIEDIVLIPKDTEVLLVNDSLESSTECIDNINKLGMNHLKIHPYFPGINKKYKDVRVAITPGEVDKVPKHIKEIYNIETRVMDFFTLTKIIYNLELFEENYEEASYKYLLKIVNIAKRLSQANNELKNINFHLDTIINGLNKGYIVFDNEGNVKAFNDQLKSIFDVKQKFIEGNKINNIIKSHKIVDFLTEKKDGKIEEFKYGSKVINIEKIVIIKENLNLGIVECIREEKSISENIIAKGFVAKYKFEDIIGSSINIKKSKDIANKLAQSDLTILIEGESGAGKELFASSIHRESKRRKGPFLAVNFSALPEDLLESHLFGYEEGAFTGAKKGGNKGLFEEANGGTIFLDEIGDISMKLQTRLLRVLQEKEIMRVGSNKIISVDVRVIAATNRDLEGMILDNKFRQDLYYRLKIGYVRIPPLRERKEDVRNLINYFIHCETNEKVLLEESVFEILESYNWLGNVRELRNAVSYMVAIRDSNTIGINQIPEYIVKKTHSLHSIEGKEDGLSNIEKVEDRICTNIIKDIKMKFILEEVNRLSLSGEVVGREKIAYISKKNGLDMTVSQVRTKMDKLEKLGYIIKNKGRQGTYITEKGKLVING